MGCSSRLVFWVMRHTLTKSKQTYTPDRQNSSAGYIFYGRGPLVRDSLGQVVPGCERNVCDNGGWVKRARDGGD